MAEEVKEQVQEQSQKGQSGRKRVAYPKTCMVVQQLTPDYLSGWTDAEKASVQAGDVGQIGQIIAQKCYVHGIPVAEWHIILHDNDVRTVWSETLANYVVERKPAHFHMTIKVHTEKGLKGATLAQFAAAIGIEPEYIEKAKRGANAYDNMLAYLIHIKYDDKCQYDPHKVISGGCSKSGKPLWRPYMDIYAERKEEWEKGRASIKAQKAVQDIDALEEMILNGQVTRNQILLTDEYFTVYARNRRRCEDAFSVFQDRKIARTIQAMESGEFHVSVFFVTGKSHAGKSRFTDRLVASIREGAREKLGQEWTVCGCAASNPLDNYDGSEILVMDDLRGVAMSASDWLKLLDPDRVNLISARYHNKYVATRVIIINSEKPLLDFFFYLKGSGGGDRGEALDQFFRRILAHVVVYRVPDDMDTRRVLVGEMRETAPYSVESPKGPSDNNGAGLTLHHDYKDGEKDMGYDEALEWLTGLTMKQNGWKPPAPPVTEPPVTSVGIKYNPMNDPNRQYG